jgi:regulator of RNase E activity RraB
MVTKMKKWKFYDTPQEEIDKLEIKELEELLYESDEEHPDITKEMVASMHRQLRMQKFEQAGKFVKRMKISRLTLAEKREVRYQGWEKRFEEDEV